MRRALGLGVATVALTLVGSSTAWAHECFVANRSDQGNASAAVHSQAWTAITPEILFSVIVPLTGDAYDCAVEAWKANPQLPDYVVVGTKQAHGQGGVIAENNPNFAVGKASDGKGIDHAEDVYTASIGEIVGFCTSA